MQKVSAPLLERVQTAPTLGHARTQAHSMDVIFDEIKGAQRSPPSGRLYPHGLYASQWLRPAPCSPRVKAPQRSSGRVLGDVPVNGALGGVE